MSTEVFERQRIFARCTNIAEIVGQLKNERNRLDRAIAALSRLTGTPKRALKEAISSPEDGARIAKRGLAGRSEGRTKVRMSLAVSTRNGSEIRAVLEDYTNYL
jgi:hypothetical protein